MSLGTAPPAKAPDCLPKTEDEQLLRLISAFDGASKVATKILRWGADSKEPREWVPECGITNRALMIDALEVVLTEARVAQENLAVRLSAVSVLDAQELNRALAAVKRDYGPLGILSLLRHFKVEGAEGLLAYRHDVLNYINGLLKEPVEGPTGKPEDGKDDRLEPMPKRPNVSASYEEWFAFLNFHYTRLGEKAFLKAVWQHGNYPASNTAAYLARNYRGRTNIASIAKTLMDTSTPDQ